MLTIGSNCIVGDGAHTSLKRKPEGILYLTSKNFKHTGLDLSKCDYISESDFQKHFKDNGKALTKPQSGDVLFSIIGSIGAPYVVQDDDEFGLSSSVSIIRPTEKLNSQFLFYWIKSPYFQKSIYQTKSGVAQSYLSLDMIRDLPLLLPPLPTQKRIADILSAYDDLIENNNRRIALLEQAARHLYKEWFVRFKYPGHEKVKIVDGVPEGWERKTAYDVMDVLSGGTPKTGNPEFWGGNIPFFTPKDATQYSYAESTEKYLTERGLQKCNSRLYPKDTVFITARGTVGKLNLAKRPMAMNQSCYALVGKSGITQKFLYCVLQSAIEEFRSRASGAVFNAIVVDTFKMIPFLLPRQHIIYLFQDVIEDNFRQVENILCQNEKLKVSRDSLLPKLINGELPL
jgi:type I restriction enzyme S subunit